MRFPIIPTNKTILALCAALLAGCATTGAPEGKWIAETPDTTTPAAPPAAALPERPLLAELLELALERNPRIRAARERALAAAESPRIDGSLPDPKLLLGWYETPVETRVGPQEYSLGIQQPIPFPSKLKTRAELGATMARRQVVVYERAVRDVLVEVVQVAHELVYLDSAVAITHAIEALLQRYSAKAAADPTLRELFRAETQRAQLENDRVLLRELHAAEAERLRALLDLPEAAPVGTIALSAPPDVDASFADLLETARAHNHELKQAGLDVEAAALKTSLARQERLPDFTLGFTQIFTDELGGSTVAGNGDDPRIVTLGLTLPLWVGRNSARIRQARALERAAQLERSDAESRLRARLARVWFEVGNARRLARLYEEVLIPRAETAARTAEDLEAAGKGTLGGALETIAVLHQFRLAHARARADHGQAVAGLEALLGRPLEVEE